MSKPKEIIELEKAFKVTIHEYDDERQSYDWENSISYKCDNQNNIILLILRNCNISDVSKLQSLISLQELDLSENQIVDITPIRNLTLLKELDLSDNKIVDIHPLENLILLSRLCLSTNLISDINPLKYIFNLKELFISHNKLKNIDVLQYLSLSMLYLECNHLKDISSLKSLKSIYRLGLYDNQIQDISPLRNLKNLTDLDLRNNKILELTDLEELHSLTNLSISGNNINDYIPLKSLKKLQVLNSNFKILGKGNFLIFDIETTGIPRNWKVCSDLSNCPRLVQIGWKLFDENRNLIEEVEYIIEPNGFEISQEATKIHGISNKYALEVGIPLVEVLDSFNIALIRADYVVAHNMSFDENIIGAECIRGGKGNVLEKCTKICTMLSSIEFCNIRIGNEYKYPKLSELYLKLFNVKLEEKHNALYDVEATADCFWKMLDLDMVSLSNNNNNSKINKMSIKTKTEWLRGFLEAIELNDNISKKQIHMLKEKLDDLLKTVEGKETSSTYVMPSSDVADDLPF